MKSLAFIIVLHLCLSGYAQTGGDNEEMTPQLQTKIKNDVEKLIPSFKNRLAKQKLNDAQVEFEIDTFRIERFMEKWIAANYTDAGMSDGMYAGAKLYDSLLNKYYKKLLAVLKPEDKKILIQAQKAWITFRGAEYTLVETISKDEYSGGGTIQRLSVSGEYLDLIKSRTLAIFNHYTRATQ